MLGSLILFPGLTNAMLEELPAEALHRHCVEKKTKEAKSAEPLFYSIGRQAIFEAILQLHERSIPPSLVIVCEELREMGFASLAMDDLYDCESEPTGSAYFKGYLGPVLKYWGVRRALSCVKGTISSLDAGGFSEKIQNLGAELVLLGDQADLKKAKPYSESVIDSLAKIEHEHENPRENPGVSTTFETLDRVTCGLKPGELTVIGARTSVGKSVLSAQIALDAAMNHGKRVLFFALEMSRDESTRRAISYLSSVPFGTIRARMANPLQRGQILEATEKLMQSKFEIDDGAGLTISQIRARADQFASRNGGVDLIVVDYIQLVRTPGRGQRAQEIGDVTRGLKILAREHNCPVITPAQLRRPDPKTKQKMDIIPGLEALRESGDIEQDADVVLFLHRPDIQEGETRIALKKQRNGPLVTFDAMFFGSSMKFLEVEQNERRK